MLLGVADTFPSSIHSTGQVSNWNTITDLRHQMEDSIWSLINRLIDDRHALEARVLILERKLREAQGSNGRLA
jgi:hypothetical protein